MGTDIGSKGPGDEASSHEDPEKYRGLIVCIAGYSAYFVDLTPDQQAEIIARTEEAS